ncbi:uncharacterized protein LOC111489991 isoform X1 [Cucurbita maxima]|uniref:Uncharacterized protein LOC111489991 isoform X1 n=1 Tax=Cucurbita maxima TaxID=3661 RepID=A0A6J1K0H5_CUCMA|nr:uncharacterized protein LOC111489991 isoform X1 [Cucurbita maxima]
MRLKTMEIRQFPLVILAELNVDPLEMDEDSFVHVSASTISRILRIIVLFLFGCQKPVLLEASYVRSPFIQLQNEALIIFMGSTMIGGQTLLESEDYFILFFWHKPIASKYCFFSFPS